MKEYTKAHTKLLECFKKSTKAHFKVFQLLIGLKKFLKVYTISYHSSEKLTKVQSKSFWKPTKPQSLLTFKQRSQKSTKVHLKVHSCSKSIKRSYHTSGGKLTKVQSKVPESLQKLNYRSWNSSKVHKSSFTNLPALHRII